MSRATMSGLCISLPVDRAQLSQQLKKYGPLRIAGEPSDQHPLLCELWTVYAGRATPGGVDAEKAATQWVAALAGWSGLVWGAGLGWLEGVTAPKPSGITASIESGARRGFEEMSALAAQQMRDVGQIASLGPYHELMFAVPDVCVADGQTRYTAVLAMLTDSRIALQIDSAFAYGYDKRLGSFDIGGPGSWDVSVETQLWLRARLSPTPPSGEQVEQVNRWWSQPLLGGLHEGQLSMSRLDRRIEAEGSWASLSGNVQWSCHELAPGESRASGGPAESSPQLAVAFHDVDSKISYPEPLG